MSLVELDLQWWQSVVAIVAALGLSPAPWILGLALGRITFTATAQAAHTRLELALTSGHTAAIAELTMHYAERDRIRDEANEDREAQHSRELTDVRQSRDYYREARIVESNRANKATEQLADVAGEAGKIATAALSAIDNAKGQP